MTASIAAPIGADLGLNRPAVKNRTRSKRRVETKQKRSNARSRTRTQDQTTPRASVILRQLLEDESRKSLTIEEIVSGLGPRSMPTSLMLFTIPEVLPIPIPGLSTAVVIPTGIISYQMLRGQEDLSLPRWLLDRSVPRSAFSACVNTILPFLEKAEGKVRPRWRWVSSRAAKRFIGFFVLLMAAIVALPIPFTNMPFAIAIFIIALGLAEEDGALICLGLLLGIALVALLGVAAFGILSLFGVAPQL
ncbi:MAG: exopolysaccharide biosynthesis protein [Verrucomicrobia bacterium]|nr:exopolysaccharide biosynthesis protein [Verrucomicrobiota bacterium]